MFHKNNFENYSGFQGDKRFKDLSVQEWVHLITSFLEITSYLAFAGFLMYKYTSNSDHYVFSAMVIILFGMVKINVLLVE